MGAKHPNTMKKRTWLPEPHGDRGISVRAGLKKLDSDISGKTALY
jgi:hypothetical protein